MKIEIAKTKQCCRNLTQKCVTTKCMAWVDKGSDADYIDAQNQAEDKLQASGEVVSSEPVDCGYCGLVTVNS